MTSPHLAEIEVDAAALAIESGFSSAHWLTYFNDNRQARVDITFPNQIAVPVSLRTPLLRSLQRFQIGETGEGKHLRKYASRMKDPVYEECIDLFIKEEQFHASVLAQMIQSMDGTLLSWHWSSLAFIALRRMLGLKTEVFILLIAEIIGKCFYKTCADHLDNRLLSDAFSLIVLDEIGHLEFHCSFLQEQMKPFPYAVRRGVHYAWCMLFVTACLVFIADHKRSLIALNVLPRDFMQDCSNTFHRAAMRALLLHPEQLQNKI
jgi:rubrerythrin